MKRPWLVMSSSSGKTLKALWEKLDEETRAACLGLVTDRNCEAVVVAAQLGLKVEVGAKETVETMAFRKLGQREDAVVFLCGYFALLSDGFLFGCPAPVVNTHPSLLPAFPGLDRKVHADAADRVAVSGFTVHLVTKALDGGPVLFQHPVAVEPTMDAEAVRNAVRAAEQKWLPRVLTKVLESSIEPSDAQLSTAALRAKYSFSIPSFQEMD